MARLLFCGLLAFPSGADIIKDDFDMSEDGLSLLQVSARSHASLDDSVSARECDAGTSVEVCERGSRPIGGMRSGMNAQACMSMCQGLPQCVAAMNLGTRCLVMSSCPTRSQRARPGYTLFKCAEAATTAPPTTAAPVVSAVGDPHITSISGAKRDLEEESDADALLREHFGLEDGVALLEDLDKEQTSGRVCTEKEAQGVCTSAAERIGSMQSGLTAERCQAACAAEPSCTNVWSIMNFRCQMYSSCTSFRPMTFTSPTIKLYECAEEEVVSAVGDPHITTDTGRHFDLAH